MPHVVAFTLLWPFPGHVSECSVLGFGSEGSPCQKILRLPRATSHVARGPEAMTLQGTQGGGDNCRSASCFFPLLYTLCSLVPGTRNFYSSKWRTMCCLGVVKHYKTGEKRS